MKDSPERNRLGIVFPPGRDPHAWARGHSNNELPDRWPYGLDRVGAPGQELIGFQSGPMLPRYKGLAAAHLLGLHGLRGLSRGVADVSLAWEEQTALKMISQYPAAAMFSGVIWATDIWESQGGSMRGIILRRLLSTLTGLWCLSLAQVEKIEKHTRNRVPVDYLPFGVDHNFFTPNRLPERQRIISLGVDRDRDPETLFRALEIVHKQVPQAEILVQTESRLPLPEGVKRFDRVPHSHLRDLYKESTVVLVATKPNLHASGMTVALEAGASGRPVVACDTPGMAEYVREGITGRLVPSGNPTLMASATIEILKDEKYAESLGVEARKHVELSHTTNLMVDRLKTIVAKGI